MLFASMNDMESLSEESLDTVEIQVRTPRTDKSGRRRNLQCHLSEM